jgi:hypothetical protein
MKNIMLKDITMKKQLTVKKAPYVNNQTKIIYGIVDTSGYHYDKFQDIDYTTIQQHRTPVIEELLILLS